MQGFWAVLQKTKGGDRVFFPTPNTVNINLVYLFYSLLFYSLLNRLIWLNVACQRLILLMNEMHSFEV